jgi:transposase-like protein
MSQSRNKIPPEIKSQILSELQVPGSMVSKLAKSYNVSKTTIYTWQQERQRLDIDNGNEIDRGSSFVELSVKESKNSTLEKASLIFNDFSLVIEGRVKSASLLAILKILEEQSC